jgi:hypothetical protein
MNYSVHPQANISNTGSSNSNGNETDTNIEFIGQIKPVLVRTTKIWYVQYPEQALSAG